MMSALRLWAHRIDWFCGRIDAAVRIALMGFMGLILSLLILQVLMRYVVRTPLIWVEELTSYSLAFVVLWGAASYIRSWQHIRVDTLFNALPEKVRMVLALFLNVLVVYFGYLLLTAGHQLAMLGAADLSDSGMFNLFWPRQAMTTGGVLFILQGGNNLLRILAGNSGPLVHSER
jgi:TRAP-type transport system small permease protein